MRLFLDANVIVSAVLFQNSQVGRFLENAVEHHTIVISTFIIDELYAVFEQKFADHTPDLDQFLSELSYELIHFPRHLDRTQYPVLRDEADFPVIASAVIGDCDYLITGDKDILAVQLERPIVMTPSDFQRLHLEHSDESE